MSADVVRALKEIADELKRIREILEIRKERRHAKCNDTFCVNGGNKGNGGMICERCAPF